MRICEDLAAFKATMFIAPYGEQPLENWRVKGSPTMHEIVTQQLLVEMFLVKKKTFHVLNFHSLWRLQKILNNENSQIYSATLWRTLLVFFTLAERFCQYQLNVWYLAPCFVLWTKLLSQEMEEDEVEERQPLLTSKMSSTTVNRELVKVQKERAATVGQSRV